MGGKYSDITGKAMKKIEAEARRQLSNQAAPPSRSMSDRDIERLRRELPDMSSAQRANVIRQLYERYPDQREGILGFIAEIESQRPTSVRLDDLRKRADEQQFRMQRDEERRYWQSMQEREQRREREARERVARTLRDKIRTEPPVRLGKERDYFSVTELQQIYDKNTRKLVPDLPAAEIDRRFQEEMARINEIEAQKFADYNRMPLGMMDMQSGVMTMPRAVKTPAKPAAKPVPVAPTGGRRKIRLED